MSGSSGKGAPLGALTKSVGEEGDRYASCYVGSAGTPSPLVLPDQLDFLFTNAVGVCVCVDTTCVMVPRVPLARFKVTCIFRKISKRTCR